MEDQGEIVKRNYGAALGNGHFSISGYTRNIFELFYRYWNALQVGEVKNGILTAQKHIDPRPVGTWRLMMLTLTYLTTNQSEQCPQADHALFEPLL